MVEMTALTSHGLLGLTIAACVAYSPAAGTLAQDSPESPLTSIHTLRCEFSVRTSVLWKDGKPEARTETTTARLTISEIDVQGGTAEIGGPQGRRFVTAMLSDGSLFVMEPTRGGLYVTTVFATESSPGKLKAVRAEYSYVYLVVPPLVPDPTVWHSYGECQPGV